MMSSSSVQLVHCEVCLYTSSTQVLNFVNRFSRCETLLVSGDIEQRLKCLSVFLARTRISLVRLMQVLYYIMFLLGELLLCLLHVCYTEVFYLHFDLLLLY